MQQPKPIDPATYQAAYELIATIDARLRRRTTHYYDTAGNLLIHLDQVVTAIMENRLAIAPPQSPPPGGRQLLPSPTPYVGEGERSEWGGVTQGATQ